MTAVKRVEAISTSRPARHRVTYAPDSQYLRLHRHRFTDCCIICILTCLACSVYTDTGLFVFAFTLSNHHSFEDRITNRSVSGPDRDNLNII